MQYTYSLCEPFNPIGNHFFPFYCFSQQQVQPTTILISNSEFSHEPEKESETSPKLIRSQTTLGERSASPEAKKKVKKVGKLIKKESTMKKDESFGFRNQNKDRNLLSSILKGYVHFILHNRGMIKLIETLAKRQQLQNGVSSYYDYMSTTFPTKKTYVGIQYLQNAMKDLSRPSEMRYILAVTLKHYFSDIYPLSLLQGSRLKKKLRLSLLKKARSILSTLFQA